jgi:hypothetical protein
VHCLYKEGGQEGDRGEGSVWYVAEEGGGRREGEEGIGRREKEEGETGPCNIAFVGECIGRGREEGEREKEGGRREKFAYLIFSGPPHFPGGRRPRKDCC